MTDSTLTFLSVLAAFSGLCCLAWAAYWLVSDNRARRQQPRKRVTLVDPLAPAFQLPRLHHDCAHCFITVLDPPGEALQFCTRCGLPWTRSYSVADAVATPEEETTLPTGGNAA